MKNPKKIISVALSVLIAAGTLSAFPMTASAEIDFNDLPTPIFSEKEEKSFKKSYPKNLKAEESYYGYYYGSSCSLTWDKVPNALCYNIYMKKKNDKKFIRQNIVLDNYAYLYFSDIPEGSLVYVTAVTFNEDDEEIESRKSKIITLNTQKEETSAELNEEAGDADIEYESEDYYDEEYYEEETAAADYENTVMTTAAVDIGYVYPEDTEEYDDSPESGYKNASTDPLSTFSADVDTASYANLRRLIRSGSSVPSDSVRIEEMLNYFDYNFTEPKGTAPFSMTYEFTDCPWNTDNKVMMIGIQGKDIAEAETPASNLVFLVDVSGSMDYEDKLPLVIESINTLAETMTEKDRISIVTYSGYERVILAGAKGNQKNTVKTLSGALSADGSTNGEGGIRAAYDLAEHYFIKGGNNRIILCSDGDLNVGIYDTDELVKLIEEKRESGIYLTTMGYGTGNLKDEKMEALADNGNGSYHYIDCAEEAKKVLVEERNSTLFTIAKDVKFQVEFNPANVKQYRLIGYDNRRLNNEDFTDDKKDAGDVGAGDSVIVLYEIVPADGKASDDLKYQTSTGKNADEWATVKIRYKKPGKDNSVQIKSVIKDSAYTNPAEIGDRLKFACAVAEFGLIVKDSEYKENASLKDVNKLLNGITEESIGYSSDFKEMVKLYEKKYKDE